MLDPFEGMANRPMSLNGYSWVEGNVPNRVDPSGEQCEPLSEVMWPKAHSRTSACENLQNKLFSTLWSPISWDEVFGCYSCVMTEVPGWELRNVESYRRGLMQAVYDEMKGARVARVETAIAQYANSYNTPVIHDPGWGDEGYIEGFSYGGGALFGVQLGRETVYDFATFQRAVFAYSGSGVHWPSIGITAYYGYVEGFRDDPSQNIDKFSGGIFFAQYGDGGTFYVRSGSSNFGGAIPVSVGTSHFWSDAGVSGNTYNIGVGPSILFEAGQYTIWYWQQGGEKSYVDFHCRVKMDELENDIRNGNGSVFSGILDGLAIRLALNTARELAVSFAKNHARNFNDKHGGNSCSCRPEG